MGLNATGVAIDQVGLIFSHLSVVEFNFVLGRKTFISELFWLLGESV